jgi:hypothetical protein
MVQHKACDVKKNYFNLDNLTVIWQYSHGTSVSQHSLLVSGIMMCHIFEICNGKLEGAIEIDNLLAKKPPL